MTKQITKTIGISSSNVRRVYVCIVYFYILCISGLNGIRLVKLKVPSYKFRGENAVLGCVYDLEGEQLYSVKWYKDGSEFFRFIPGDQDQIITTFKLPGIEVDEMKSNQNQVTLKDMMLKSAGQFRCEISAEAPLFNTVSQSSPLTIIALPETGPRISGGKKTYYRGDVVRVNCTSARSKPAAKLHWFVNNNKVPKDALVRYAPIVHEDGLETAILGLEMKITQATFNTRRRYSSVKETTYQKVASSPSDVAQSVHGDETVRLLLQCRSEVATRDHGRNQQKTHAQKSAVHTSLGYMFLSGGSSSSMTSSPFLMVFAIFLNMTVVCLQRGNTFALRNTTDCKNTTKDSQTLVKSLIIILLRMSKQTKRFYSNLLSHFSLPSLLITFTKLTRLVSKHQNHLKLQLLSVEDKKRCAEKTIDKIGVKRKQIQEIS